MAKKATTGGPTRRKQSPDREERQIYLSRAEREARTQRWILLGMGIILGAILLLLVFGVGYEAIIFPNQPVASVNGQTITTSDYQARVRFARWQLGVGLEQAARQFGMDALTDSNHPLYQQLNQQLQQLQPGFESIIGDQVVEEMIEERLMQEAAEALDVTVDQELVDERIEQFFGFDSNRYTPTPTSEPSETPTLIVSRTPSPAPTASSTPEPASDDQEMPTATMTPVDTATPSPTLTVGEEREIYDEFQTEYFNEGMAQSGLSEEQVRLIFEMQALRDELFETVTGDLPRIEEQANARHILVTTEQEAEDILAALREGESFAELAQAVSQDPGSAAQGGELDWVGRGTFVPAFDDAVFNGEVGEFIGPIETDFGFHIIQIHAREERELTDSQYNTSRQSDFQEWLEGLRTAEDNTVETFDYSDRIPSQPDLYDFSFAG